MTIYVVGSETDANNLQLALIESDDIRVADGLPPLESDVLIVESRHLARHLAATFDACNDLLAPGSQIRTVNLVT